MAAPRGRKCREITLFLFLRILPRSAILAKIALLTFIVSLFLFQAEAPLAQLTNFEQQQQQHQSSSPSSGSKPSNLNGK